MIWKTLAVAAITAGFIVVAAGTANAQSHVQFSNMHDFDSGEDLAGGGYLTRTEDQASARLSLSGLDKKAAYTLWFVVFNSPGDCAAIPCSLGDLGSADASILWAGGFVTGTDGTANVTVHLDSSDIPVGTDVLLGTGLNPGNGFDAEIHLIVRTHGKTIVGSVDSQIGSFAGQCDVNDCADQQAVIFLPVP